MHWPLALFIFITLATSGFAQTKGSPAPEHGLLGHVRSIKRERVYLIVNGVSANEKTELIRFSEFDVNGKVTRVSTYGSIEERITFKRSEGAILAAISYFDGNGEPVADGEARFHPPVGEESDEGLCDSYTARIEEDEIAKLRRAIETCTDGSHRATVQVDYDEQGRTIQRNRTDSKKRSWTRTYRYSTRNIIEEMVFRVVEETRTYGQRMESRNQKFDEQGNVISELVTAFDLNNPNRILYQYIERDTIAYYK